MCAWVNVWRSEDHRCKLSLAFHCGSREPNSGLRARQQTPLPVEPSHWPLGFAPFPAPGLISAFAFSFLDTYELALLTRENVVYYGSQGYLGTTLVQVCLSPQPIAVM